MNGAMVNSGGKKERAEIIREPRAYYQVRAERARRKRQATTDGGTVNYDGAREIMIVPLDFQSIRRRLCPPTVHLSKKNAPCIDEK